MSFVVGGAVQTETTLTLADLQGLPTQTVTAETRTRMGSQGTATYRGVLLKDVLNVAKLQLDPNAKNDQLARAITAYGSDGYHATIAYGEIDPDFGGQPILVAFEMNDQPLADGDGIMELVVSGDKLAGRWVKNLVALTVTAPGHVLKWRGFHHGGAEDTEETQREQIVLSLPLRVLRVLKVKFPTLCVLCVSVVNAFPPCALLRLRTGPSMIYERTHPP